LRSKFDQLGVVGYGAIIIGIGFVHLCLAPIGINAGRIGFDELVVLDYRKKPLYRPPWPLRPVLVLQQEVGLPWRSPGDRSYCQYEPGVSAKLERHWLEFREKPARRKSKS